MIIYKEMEGYLKSTAAEQFIFYRGCVLNCFAQVEWFMAKILIEAHAFPEYRNLDLDFSVKAENRAKKVKVLLAAEGRLKKYQDQLSPIIDEVMSFMEIRNFMAHGVVISKLDPLNGLVFRMKIFKRMSGADDHEGKIDFTAKQLEIETRKISTAAVTFISEIREIWREQGMKHFDVEF